MWFLTIQYKSGGPVLFLQFFKIYADAYRFITTWASVKDSIFLFSCSYLISFPVGFESATQSSLIIIIIIQNPLYCLFGSFFIHGSWHWFGYNPQAHLAACSIFLLQRCPFSKIITSYYFIYFFEIFRKVKSNYKHNWSSGCFSSSMFALVEHCHCALEQGS